MKNPLRKRLLRELKNDIGKYLVIFLFMTATIGFVSGFLVADESMLYAYDESFEKYNVENGNFTTEQKLTDNQRTRLEKEKVTIYENFYKDEDADTDLDQDKVQSMLSALSSYVSGQITPADGADPAACGFDAPLAVVQVTTADGTKTLTYASGTDGDYLMVEGDDSIYAVDGSIVQAVTRTADALTAA